MTTCASRIVMAALLCVSTELFAQNLVRTVNNGNLVLHDIPEIPQSIVEDLNRYQNVRSAIFRAFNKDGTGVFITTRFGDTNQIHRVDTAGGARHQLTFFREPVGLIERRPHTNHLAFTMDSGGNENTQIFLFDPADATSKRLTDGQSRNGFMKWDRTGNWLAYQSTRRNGTANDIWILDPQQPDSARMLVEAPDGAHWAPVEFSPDSTKLLVQKYVDANDSSIYVVDVASGERTLIVGSTEPTSVNRAFAYDSQGQGLFFVTNTHSEFQQLSYRRLDSTKIQVITHQIPWDVTDFAISPVGKRAAFSVNEDGFHKLYLLNLETLQFAPVKNLPIGLVSGIQFSEDGTNLGLTLNTAQTPSDTFVLALGKRPTEAKGLSRWTYSEVGGLDTTRFIQPQLVRFPSFDQRQIPAFVFKPNKSGPHPVIISIHGGPEAQYQPGFASTYQLWLDKLGAAVIAPNVRGSSGYGKEYVDLDNGKLREDSVKDIGALLDWIQTQPDLDSSRVAVFGGSYGGYMVLASAVHYSNRLKAAVDIVGISNFVTFLENTKDYRRDLRRAEYGDERDPEMRAFFDKISPLKRVEQINVPLFVVQGQNDPRVPVTEAEQIVAALRKDKKDVWYMNALNEGHGYSKKENQDVYQQAVVLFFQRFL
ncbi:MAG: S9 family peptidase [Myxococcales bacterium]|nr:S9 family peptidase [Myxococcales bacterium]